MEQDLGISELSEPEKCVFSCIVQATEAGGSITTKAIEQHHADLELVATNSV